MAAGKAREQREARRLRSEGLRSIARHLGVSLSSVSVWTRGIQPVAAVRPVQPETRPPEAQKPPETRICGGCRRRRELTEFHRQQSWCKQCRAEYIRDRGELHRRQTRAARDRRRAVARGHVLGLLTKARCADCGLADPLVLEFDHIGNKTAGVSFSCARAIGSPASRPRSHAVRSSALIAIAGAPLPGPEARGDSISTHTFRLIGPSRGATSSSSWIIFAAPPA
jgi:hypothetical protein